VVFDIASHVEDNEAREPADGPQHQREDDHQLRVMCDQVESMLVGSVYRVADEQGNDHRERGVRERARDPEYVSQPVASRVKEQSFHGLSVKLSGLRRDRSGCSLATEASIASACMRLTARCAISIGARRASRISETRRMRPSSRRTIRVRRRGTRRGEYKN